VENLLVEAKIGTTWYLFGRRAEERGACRLAYTALSLQSDFKQGRYLSSSDHSFLRFLQHAFRAIIQDERLFVALLPRFSSTLGLFLLLAFFCPQASSTHEHLLLSTLAFSSFWLLIQKNLYF
jgi:hypothetical protein